MAGKPCTFITLTCDPKLWISPGEAARGMSKAWRACRRAIEGEYGGKKGEYLTVVEATERGWPHLHVLTTRPWIDQRWLSKLWFDLTGASIVDIQRVKNGAHAAAYISKYLGKAPHKFLHCKRYYFTRGYVPKREQSGDSFDWSLATHETLSGHEDVLALALMASGWQQIEAAEGYYVLARGDPLSPSRVAQEPGHEAVAA